MRLLTSLAAAAAVALSLNASVAFADDENDENFVEPIAPQADTIFDLGVDVAPVAKNPFAVRAYLSALSPLTRDVILTTCEHYMLTPNSVQQSQTLEFCSIAVGG